VASGGANLSFSATSGTNTTGSVAGPVVVAPQATSASQSGLTFNGTTVGATQNGTFSVIDPAAGNTPQSGTVTVAVYGHAAPDLTTGTLALGNVHVGYTSAVTSSTLSVNNTAGFRANLKGSTGAIGNISVGSVNGIAQARAPPSARHWPPARARERSARASPTRLATIPS